MKAKIYTGVLHYPVYNKKMEIITTSIVIHDLHDIARLAKTYGIKNYYEIEPLEGERSVAKRIINFWQDGFGKEYNLNRAEAIEIVKVVSSFEECLEDISRKEGKCPDIITTDARRYPNTISYKNLRKVFEEEESPFLILFGTGWGIEKSIMLKGRFVLDPIISQASSYNHLSVRSAAAIIFDRLLGKREL